jgi:hypothetical protein
MFVTLACVGLFVVVFIALKNYDTSKALSTSAFISTIIATMFFLLGMVSYYLIIVFATLLLCGILFPVLKGRIT